jgi:hypothetical protein
MSMIVAGIGLATTVGTSLYKGNQAEIAGRGQLNAAREGMAMEERMFNQQMDLLDPYRQIGLQGLESLGGIAGRPLDRQAELAQYYQSPEFAQMSGAARNQQLASSEAMGGLGSTSTGNALASIAPQLGQGYLSQRAGQQQDIYNQMLGLSNIGLSGAGAQAQFAGNYGSNTANALNQSAGQQAQNRMGVANMWGNTIGNVAGIGANFFGQPKAGG